MWALGFLCRRRLGEESGLRLTSIAQALLSCGWEGAAALTTLLLVLVLTPMPGSGFFPLVRHSLGPHIWGVREGVDRRDLSLLVSVLGSVLEPPTSLPFWPSPLGVRTTPPSQATAAPSPCQDQVFLTLPTPPGGSWVI